MKLRRHRPKKIRQGKLFAIQEGDSYRELCQGMCVLQVHSQVQEESGKAVRKESQVHRNPI